MRSARGFTLASRREGAFTLIELMVTIAIISILATVGLVVYRSSQQNARDTKRTSDIQEIQKALEQYFIANSYYPTAGSFASALNSYFPGGVLPTDPNGSSYIYRDCSTDTSLGNNKHYVLCTGSLETNKGNASAVPPAGSGCSGYTQSSATTNFCVSQISN